VLRDKLATLLHTVLAEHEDTSYYQGLNDIAAVLMLTCSDGAALAMLRRIVRCHLAGAALLGLFLESKGLGFVERLILRRLFRHFSH
jgi:hypothetical protein